MNKPVSNTSRQRRGQHARLAFYMTIGFLMVGVAVLGYAFLGPYAGVALGAHVRPADVATNESTNGVLTGRSVTPVRNGSFTPADLASMQAEMDRITDQANALLKELPVQGTTSLVDLGSQAALPAVSITNAVGSRAYLPAPVSDRDELMSTLEATIYTLDHLISAMDKTLNDLEDAAGAGEMGNK